MVKGVVAAGHQKTAGAAAHILRAGGNAYDAIAAGFFAACITEPVLTSLGGGGFLAALPAAGRSRAYDFFCQTPLQRRAEGSLDFHPILADFGTDQQEFHIGLGAVATPGAVAGLFAMHADLGRLPMPVVMQPAIELARDGVTVTAFQAYVLDVVRAIYQRDAHTRALFASPGQDADQLLQEGDVFRNPQLADLLDALSREGAALFYRGEVAQRIAEQCREGGHLTRGDLQQYRVEKRQLLKQNFAGWTVLLNPPPASGGLLVALGLALLAGDLLPTADMDATAHALRIAEVLRATHQLRVAAEASGPVQADSLLEPGLLAQYRQQIAGRLQAPRGTTHLSVLDADGNAAALTVSNGEGCGPLLPGCGFMLNNMLGEQDLHPRGFASWQPDQRLSSMMCPGIAVHPSGDLLAFGSGGSNRIRSAILQVLVNQLALGMPLEAALEAPRMHVENDWISIEGGHSDEVTQTLQQAFTSHTSWADRNLFFGGVHAVARQGGQLLGHGDSRRNGRAICV